MDAKWFTEERLDWINKFLSTKLAIVLVILFLAMFMGYLPSPMLSAIAQVTQEHAGITRILRQICANGAKSVEALNRCYYEEQTH